MSACDNEQSIYFSRYRLMKFLAKGGMGEVYEAFDPKLCRKIALKRVRKELLKSACARNRFLRESCILASLSHPSIIPIFEIGEETGIPYYTMPLIAGVNLKQYIRKFYNRRNPNNVATLLKLFLEVCHGIMHVHSHGVLHRDIKAENIMFSEAGQVIIIDWGLAYSSGFDQANMSLNDDPGPSCKKITRYGKCPGTLNYMAPEQLFGPATKKSDIYSLGVLFYLILTGKMPFKRKRVHDFKNNWQQESWEDPRSIVSEYYVPDILIKIVEKTLTSDIDSRYESVAELIRDLRTFLEGVLDRVFERELAFCPSDNWDVAPFSTSLRTVHALLPDSPVHVFIGTVVLKSNFRLEIDVQSIDDGGFGIFFDSPYPYDTLDLKLGCLLWISFRSTMPTALYRNGAMLFALPFVEYDVTEKQSFVVELEVDDYDMRFSFGKGVHTFVFPKIYPPMGSKMGCVFTKPESCLRKVRIFSSGLLLRQSCLQVPNSFMLRGSLSEALEEYRCIWETLSGYEEAQEAKFKTGLILLEQCKQVCCASQEEKRVSFSAQAWECFDALKGDNFLLKGWIGKALLYQLSGDWEEEANCLELAYHLLKDPEDKNRLEAYLLGRILTMLAGKDPRANRFLLLTARCFPRLFSHARIDEHLQELRETHPILWLFDRFCSNTLDSSDRAIQLIIEFSFLINDHNAIDVALESVLSSDVIDFDAMMCCINGLLVLKKGDLVTQLIHSLKMDTIVSTIEKEPFTRVLEIYCFFAQGDWWSFFNKVFLAQSFYDNAHVFVSIFHLLACLILWTIDVAFPICIRNAELFEHHVLSHWSMRCLYEYIRCVEHHCLFSKDAFPVLGGYLREINFVHGMHWMSSVFISFSEKMEKKKKEIDVATQINFPCAHTTCEEKAIKRFFSLLVFYLTKRYKIPRLPTKKIISKSKIFH